MTRTIEWVLAVVGAGISIAIPIYFWQQQSVMLAPGESLWSLPGAGLLEMAVLGLLGLVAVALDEERRWRRWGQFTWAVVGALFTVMLLGVFSVGPFLFPAISAFCVAAIVADRRRRRRVAAHVALAAMVAVANGMLLFILIATLAMPARL